MDHHSTIGQAFFAGAITREEALAALAAIAAPAPIPADYYGHVQDFFAGLTTREEALAALEADWDAAGWAVVALAR